MSTITINIYGVRGSSPISGPDYIEFGGNTSSYTIRTPQNTLIFLDAGTGIRLAEGELDQLANKVIMLLSHTHADHIQGFGMTRLPQLHLVEGYQNKLLQIIGPSNVGESLKRYYDGEVLWPVKFSESQSDGFPRMEGINYSSILEYSKETTKTIEIDGVTTLEMMKGNHPVRDGVMLYKFQFNTNEGIKKIVYATDNEFDFISNRRVNPEADRLKQEYLEFIENADYLIADAQYTYEDYQSQFQGYGHSYHQQVIDFAAKSNVQNLILTHHHLYSDNKLNQVETSFQNYISEKRYQISLKLAREGYKVSF